MRMLKRVYFWMAIQTKHMGLETHIPKITIVYTYTYSIFCIYIEIYIYIHIPLH